MAQLKKLVNDLEEMKDIYEDLKLLIVDQINDNEIDEAEIKFTELLQVKKAIRKMENTDFIFNKYMD